jgi:hypothetical protein
MVDAFRRHLSCRGGHLFRVNDDPVCHALAIEDFKEPCMQAIERGLANIVTKHSLPHCLNANVLFVSKEHEYSLVAVGFHSVEV